jgi:hypothetical protein
MAPVSHTSADHGVEPVQTAPLYPGTSSQRDSSAAYAAHNASKQNNMNNTLSGGKRRLSKRRHGSRGKIVYKGGNVVVPSFSTTGPAVSSGSQSATGSSVAANTASTQGNANAVCDKCIGPEASASAICQGPQCNPQHGGKMKGGSCSEAPSGLIPNGQTWGCLSGGAKKSKKSRKSKKSKKSKKSRKSKKSKKSRKSKKSKK